MVAKKVVVSLVALILVVGAVIGIVVSINHSNGGDENNNDADKSTSTSMKAVTVICEPTQYKDACERSLDPVAKNESATTKDYILAAIHSVKEEVSKSLEFAANQKVGKEKDAVDGHQHMGVDECKKLLQYAIEDLESSVEMVGKTEMQTIGDYTREILNWLTAVYSFQSQCMGSIQNSEYKSAMKNVMVNSTQLAANAVTIVSQISEILNVLNLDQVGLDLSNFKLNSRRLLNEEAGGYPEWFRVADRKLLVENSTNVGIKPDAVVAKDGSGQYKTIGEAVAAYPKTPMPPGKRYIIYVKAGVYDEQVIIARHQENVFIYGDGPTTIVTGQKNNKIMKIQTPNTATFAAEGKGFIAKSMTFRNTAGPEGEQAVALRVMSDSAVIFDCRIEGYQDTLLYQNYRQFYRDCVITGTIDFIFGEGSALIQNSEIVVRRPGPKQNNLVITADGKELPHGVDGLVLQNCKIVVEEELFPDRHKYNIYLGRPWMPLASTVIMESELGDFLHPEGYMTWPEATNERTCNYVEYANRGPTATTDKRVNWTTFHVFQDPKQVIKYTAANFIDGQRWLKDAGVPFSLGFTH